ncbi:MAG: cell division protein PerM, partial [Streptosporangiaceae bacterium]
TSMSGFRSVDVALAPGVVGGALLLLAQIAYVPNAVVWSVCYTLGPGFAFGTGTVVAPTGSALGPLPMRPMLAALPSVAHASMPGWVSMLMLSVPYLAGAFGGLLTARAAPILALEMAPLWGFACGVATGFALGLLAAFAGGPLGSARLTAVGPSGWQAGVVCVLEVGVAAAVTAGLVNWVRIRRLTAAGLVFPGAGTERSGPPGPDLLKRGPRGTGSRLAGEPGAGMDGHHLYVDPWGDAEDAGDGGRPKPPGPAALP